MQGFIAAFGMSPWGPMALGFLVGVAFGWAVWGPRSEPSGDSGFNASDELKEIIVLKAELRAARELLDERDHDENVVTDQLLRLDEAVKRANGRLKIALNSLRRMARSE